VMRARAMWFGNKNGSSAQYQRTEAVRSMYAQGYGGEYLPVVEATYGIDDTPVWCRGARAA
jgi:hypothetical protein